MADDEGPRQRLLSVGRRGIPRLNCINRTSAKTHKTEGLLLVFENELRQVQPYTCAANLLAELNTDREYCEHDDLAYCAAEFHPEAGNFMLESIPEKPWGISSRDLLDVEANMKSR